MSRIRWKLLAAMIAVALIATGLSGLFTRRVTHEQVRRLLVAHDEAPLGELVRPIEAHYRSSGWRGIDRVAQQAASTSRRRVLLTTTGRQVIAFSGTVHDETARIDDAGRITVSRSKGSLMHLVVQVPPVPVTDAAGRRAGNVYFLPGDEPAALEFREIAVLDRRLVAAFAAAMVVAVLFTLVLSRRITSPIELLSGAVEAMTRGRVPEHVAVRGRDEIAQLARSFNSMADAIATQEDLRRRMLGDVAHELRTPLTNLRCELEAIQDGLAVPDASRISSIHDEVLHLQRLVEDLQELALADAGGLLLHRERFDLGTSIARVVELFRPEAARRRIAVEFECGGAVAVDADATRIGQIVRNLLSNALEHTPGGGRILVAVGREQANAVVSVIDSGPGIPAAELEHIFERLYRLDQSRTQGSGGAGLGLAIVRRLVELHGGSVHAESPAGGGAKFVVTIPLAS